jgi:nucleoside-diphosphate-sugar epimerase
MYGPRQAGHPVQKFMPAFIEHALQNKPLPIWGNGEQTVDAVFVKDAAEATIASLEREEAIGKVMEIGTGVATKVIDVARLVISMCNSKSTPEFKPMRRGEPPSHHLVGDVSEAEKIIGWRARTTLRQGLELTIPFYVEQAKRKGLPRVQTKSR